jgi:formylmethanofuran dehydrogenase subunit B
MKAAGYRKIGVWVRKSEKIPTRSEISKREECSICGILTDDLEFHHSDYSKPLEGIWVCKKCHGKIHGIFNVKRLFNQQKIGQD